MSTAVRMLCVCTICLAGNLAAAEVARFSYETVVTSVDVPLGHPIQGRLRPGDKVSGTLQYDLGLADYFTGVPTLGSYEALPAGHNHFQARGGNGFLFDSALIDRPFFVATVDDGPYFDTLLINMSGDTAPSTLQRPDTRFVEMGLLLETGNTSLFRSDALPTQLSLSDFELAGIDFFGAGTSFPTFLVHTTITALETMLPMLPGDFSGNGRVEQRDLDLVLLNWGRSAQLAPAAWTGLAPVGNIDQAELDAVLLNWGSAAAAAMAVPEPATLWLALLLGTPPLVARVRRSLTPR